MFIVCLIFHMYLLENILATQEVSVMPAGDHEIKCMACGLNCPIEAEDKMERSFAERGNFLYGQIKLLF